MSMTPQLNSANHFIFIYFNRHALILVLLCIFWLYCVFFCVFSLRYKLKDGSKKEALLNDEDELWVKLRHMHIAEVTG